MQSKIERLALSYIAPVKRVSPKHGQRLANRIEELEKTGNNFDKGFIEIFNRAKEESQIDKSSDNRIFIALCNDFLETASLIQKMASHMENLKVADDERHELQKNSEVKVAGKYEELENKILTAKITNSSSFIVKQPQEITSYIFDFLNRNDVESVALVCTNFAAIVKKHKILDKKSPLFDFENPIIVCENEKIKPDFKHVHIAFETSNQYVGNSQIFTNRILGWNKHDKKLIHYQGHTSVVLCVEKISEEYFMTGSEDKTIRIWKISAIDTKESICLKGHSGSILCLSSLKENLIASGSNDKTIKIWDIKKQTCEQTLSGHEGPVTCIIVLSDGKIVSASEDKTIRIWNLNTNTCESIISDHTEDITSLIKLSPKGFATSSEDKTVRIWSDDGKCLQKLKVVEEKEQHVRVLKQFKNILIGLSFRNIHLWDINTGKHFLSRQFSGTIAYLALSSKGFTVHTYDEKQYSFTFNLIKNINLFDSKVNDNQETMKFQK